MDINQIQLCDFVQLNNSDWQCQYCKITIRLSKDENINNIISQNSLYKDPTLLGNFVDNHDNDRFLCDYPDTTNLYINNLYKLQDTCSISDNIKQDCGYVGITQVKFIFNIYIFIYLYIYIFIYLYIYIFIYKYIFYRVNVKIKDVVGMKLIIILIIFHGVIILVLVILLILMKLIKML